MTKKSFPHASNGNIKLPLKNLLKFKIKKCEASFSLKENPLKIRKIWCKQKIKVEAMQFIYSFRHKLQNQSPSGDASLPRTQEVWYHSLQTSQLSDHLCTCIEGPAVAVQFLFDCFVDKFSPFLTWIRGKLF